MMRESVEAKTKTLKTVMERPCRIEERGGARPPPPVPAATPPRFAASFFFWQAVK
jgi:hypothetical protein